MLTDYGTPFRQRLIHPTWIDWLTAFFRQQPDPGMPWPEPVIHKTCRCMAFKWQHAARVSTKCQERRRLDGFRR